MIAIMPYNAGWPERFADIGSTLRTLLGDTALRIDHIGSTSVPGLAAKDVIDIQVTVAGLSLVMAEVLATAGFRELPTITCDHVPPGGAAEPEAWAKRFFALGDPIRVANVHVRVDGRPNQRYALLFRDYLRAFPHAAHAYGQTKQALARHLGHDVDANYDIKDPVCDLIMGGAETWARSVGWEPARSDR